MKVNTIAFAVAAAMLSFGAVAEDKKQDSQAGSSMSQEQKPGTQGSAASGSTSSATEKKDSSAAAGASSAPSSGKKAEGSAAAGSGTKAQSGNHDAEMIKQVQEKLNVTADGRMGPQTQKALKDFQQSKGLQATGQLDQETIAALGISGSAAGGASAKAEKKAEGSAAAGGSAAPDKATTEGQSASGAATSSDRTAEPKKQ